MRGDTVGFRRARRYRALRAAVAVRAVSARFRRAFFAAVDYGNNLGLFMLRSERFRSAAAGEFLVLAICVLLSQRGIRVREKGNRMV